MAGPKPGGDKQALMDAYASAKDAPAVGGGDPSLDAAPGAEGAAPDAGPSAVGPEDPAMKSLELQVQHLEHVLLTKGILSPQDLISPPAPMAEPMAPPGPPMGGPPMGGPPGAPPLQ